MSVNGVKEKIKRSKFLSANLTPLMMSHTTVTALISSLSACSHTCYDTRSRLQVTQSSALVAHRPSHLNGESGCGTELVSGRAKGVGGAPASNSHMEGNVVGSGVGFFCRLCDRVGISRSVGGSGPFKTQRGPRSSSNAVKKNVGRKRCNMQDSPFYFLALKVSCARRDATQWPESVLLVLVALMTLE